MSGDSTFKLVNGSFLLEGPGNHSISLKHGFWILECWGASGGESYKKPIQKTFHGGRGGYSIGVLYIPERVEVFLHAGGRGASNSSGVPQHFAGGYNGGGSGYHGSFKYPVGSGGGSTDVRIGSDEINNRIIVAGGGGGAGASSNSDSGGQFGGAGGGLTGLEGGGRSDSDEVNGGKGGSQISGGAGGTYSTRTDIYGENGSLFYGGRGSNGAPTESSSGGGGGGYYGGGGSCTSGGGGGSGYIGGVISAFGIVSQTIDGNSIFPSPYVSNEEGHYGDGCIKITLITGLFDGTCQNLRSIISNSVLFFSFTHLMQIY